MFFRQTYHRARDDESYRSQLVAALWWFLAGAFILLTAIESHDHNVAVWKYCYATHGEMIDGVCWRDGHPLWFGI